MAILHGSWIVQSQGQCCDTHLTSAAPPSSGYFFLWGEIWRRVEPISDVPSTPPITVTDSDADSDSRADHSNAKPSTAQPSTAQPAETEFLNSTPSDARTLPCDRSYPHPFAMTEVELLTWLSELTQTQSLHWAVAEVSLTAPAPPNRRRKSQPPPATHRWMAIDVALPTYTWSAPSPSASATGDELSAEPLELSYLPQHSVANVLSGIEEAMPLERMGDSADADDQPEAAMTLELRPWVVEGLWLTIAEALTLLQSLPLGTVAEDDSSWIGADLRFWSHIARWQLDLSARAKFLPAYSRLEAAPDSAPPSPSAHLPAPSSDRPAPDATAAPEGETRQVCWQALLDSATDQVRLETFVRQMPGLIRAYGWHPAAPKLSTPADPQTILLQFLNRAIDTQVRSIAAQHPLPTAPLVKDVPLREWLQAMATEPTFSTDVTRLDRLEQTLSQWLAPVQRQLNQPLNAFRTCFYLHPPIVGQSDWTLEYFLQASNDPEFLISARTVWNNPVERLDYMGRTIDQPQETLLAGLGLASRLYSVIEDSLLAQQPQSCALHPLQVYEFIRSTAWRLQDSGFGVILPPSLANQEGWANRLGLRIQAETPKRGKGQSLGLQSLLNFKWELTIGGQRLSKAEFDRLVALNTPLVEINGEWVELRSQDIKAAQSFFENRKDQMALSLEDALRISTGDTQVIEKLPVLGFEASGSLQDLINTLTTGNQSVDLVEPPDSFRGELRPYQLRGVSWLAFLEQWGLGACLADDMGLGKTIELIAFLLHLQEADALEQPVLLVCPTSVLGNWEREVKRFAPSLRVMVHHGDKRPQGKAFVKAAKATHLIITSYSLVHRDLKTLQGIDWQGVVLDEAQNIKNAESKQSQAARQLDAQFRIALTGTPVENRLAELWAIMEFLNPGYLGPKNFFQRRFAIPIERYGDTASLKTLRSLVQPFILRRLKTDRSIIQDLPEKQEMTVFCGLTEAQAVLYQTMVERALADIDSAEGIQRRGLILALLVKLKQVCNHPGLYREADAIASDLDLDLDQTSLAAHSGKLQRLEEMLEELLAEGDRALIFTQFAEWGKQLQAYLIQRFQREVFFLYGSTSKKQREEMVDRFQNDPQAPRLFILSLKAGGVGLNLTRANHVFHFDRWWNPAVENQATDRVFRIGQTRNVQVHKFVCNGTLEERIHELIESKKALSEQVIGTGENWLTELDTDSLRNLLLLDRAAVIEDDGD